MSPIDINYLLGVVFVFVYYLFCFIEFKELNDCKLHLISINIAYILL
jgi:hypothetical protein